MIIIIIMFVWPSWNTVNAVKGQVQGLRWFLTRFALKFAENNDVDEIVIWGLYTPENRHFLSYRKRRHDAENHVHICALPVTLGSRCKMASSHRVTDLEKILVRISKDETLTPLSVGGPLFFPCYFIFSSLVRCVAFQSFSFCLF